MTQTFHLPDGLLSAICFIESGHKIDAVHRDDGGSDSAGVCQLKLDTARMLGFKGTEKTLMHPRNNVYYAAKYLRYQLDRYDGEFSKSVAAYNTGTFRAAKDGQPKNRKYVNKVLVYWRRSM